MTSTDWLDVHFEACRPEYEAILHSIGLRPGWRVLDADCGSGSYLPLIAAAKWRLSTPLDTRVGSVLALPYPDGTFDTVWFANTAQYLTDAELAVALGEFRRVVRSGGIVAVKEFDGTLVRIIPAPPLIGAHIGEAMATAGMRNAAGCLRASALATWLRRAGLHAVWLRTTLVERSAPLNPYERRYCDDNLRQSAPVALGLELPAEDCVLWERLIDPVERARLLDDPDFYWCEGHVVAVGTVP